MTKVALQVVAFLAVVAALAGGARWLAMRDMAAQAASPEVASGPIPTTTMPAPANDPSRGAPLRYAQLPPTALPPLFVVRDGAELPLAGARAKPLLLHLWATWCGPCRAELPAILAYGRRGPIDVIAVSVDDHFESVQQFFSGNIPPEVAWDQKITLEPALGVGSLPTTFLVDTEGRARLRWNGLQDWSSAAMNQLITAELARTLP